MMNTQDHDTLKELLPGYALGALDADEQALVEAALTGDEQARRQLAEYETVAAQLAFAAPARPAPGHLQADLKARLARERTASDGPSPRRQRIVRGYRVLSALAALVIIVIGLLLALQTGGALPPAQVYATLDLDSTTLHYPLQPGDVTAEVSGELIAAPDGRRAVIAVEALPAITPDQTFQLWVRGVDGSVRSGGLFRAAGGDVTFLSVPLQEDETLSMIRGLGVSLEPAGGSPYPDAPTGPRVFSIAVNPET